SGSLLQTFLIPKLFEYAGKEAFHLSEKAVGLLLRRRRRQHGGGHRRRSTWRRKGHAIGVQPRRWGRLQLTSTEHQWCVHLHLNLVAFGSRQRDALCGRDRQSYLRRRLCAGDRDRT